MIVQDTASPKALKAAEKLLGRKTVAVETNYPDGDDDTCRVRVLVVGQGLPQDTLQAYISPFPRCCGIAVVHSAYAPSTKGLKALLTIVESMIYEAGLMMYTTNEYQGGLAEALKALGWESGEPFLNHGSGNDVRVWTKVLEE